MESKFLSITEFIQVPKLILNPVLDLWNEWRGKGLGVGFNICCVMRDVCVLSKCSCLSCTPLFNQYYFPFKWAVSSRAGLCSVPGIPAAGNVGLWPAGLCSGPWIPNSSPTKHNCLHFPRQNHAIKKADKDLMAFQSLQSSRCPAEPQLPHQTQINAEPLILNIVLGQITKVGLVSL